MGCNPLGRMMSMACGRKGDQIRRSRSKERRPRAQERDTSPTITAVRSTYSTHPMVRSVIYSENSSNIVSHPENVVSSYSSIPCSAEMAAGREAPRRVTRVRFATPDDHNDFGSQQQQVVTTPVVLGGGVDAASAYRYMMPSSLPANQVDTREYFGSEYHYYPTPRRDGIYRLATDSDRLTTLFSEENPNACSIT